MIAAESIPSVTEHASEGISQAAPVLFHIGMIPFTSSMLVSWLITLLIIFLVRSALGKIELVPKGMQNFLEYLIESLYDTLAGIMGEHLARRTFWFFASIFLFILLSNWLGLVPLMGNITVIPEHGDQAVGLFRAVNSDLNMPFAMATLFGVLWIYWSITEIGIKGIFAHIFGVKGGLAGILKWALMPLFFFSGINRSGFHCI